MKAFALILTVLCLLSFSLSWAQEVSVEKAYSMYYKGDKEEAIRMMEDYIKDNPVPGAYYFLGYAYYEMQQMDVASEYFREAFMRSPFYSPIPK